ncbi:hypothetical protein [Aulosira sp. FACHB-615]|uniref:hypothetical protein n=1 Tax=Aulosira sp. FACHB-615 TaxID=2692777 RepID=UPI001685DF7B|nr:hypothetical protein [Aulosira sp. FACHB-615]MBD2489849.1 hypothetical protein [Aulosira sp. FACHB-615]
MNKEEIELFSKISNQFLQDIFFIIGIVITILTYINAKRTILQPIKTEVFKLQVVKFTSILDILDKQGYAEIEKCFEKILFINTCSLCDDYAELFFNIELNRNTRPYNTEQIDKIIWNVYSLEDMEEYNKLRSEFNELVTIKNNLEVSKLKEKLIHKNNLIFWNKYKYKELKITAEYMDLLKKIIDIKSSPLLPQGLLSLLEEFIEAMNKNLDLVVEILNQYTQKLPNDYFIQEIIGEKSRIFILINLIYNKELKNLELIANKIVQYIRNYWLIEKINTQ